MTKLSFPLACLLLAATSAATCAVAQVRPSAPGMSCAAAARLVASRGAVVIGTGTHTYDRYVLDGRFCGFEETTEPAWVRTADTAQCFIGYRCRTRSSDRYHGVR